jgi:hypothetical protein
MPQRWQWVPRLGFGKKRPGLRRQLDSTAETGLSLDQVGSCGAAGTDRTLSHPDQPAPGVHPVSKGAAVFSRLVVQFMAARSKGGPLGSRQRDRHFETHTWVLRVAWSSLNDIDLRRSIELIPSCL